jgi:pheromone shutdown protein TraB
MPILAYAGSSVNKPLHNNTGLFCDQDSVDSFVNSYIPSSRSAIVEDCNQFLAANALRSSTRFKALDETGLVGVVCKHEFPLMFYSLKHAERISYIVYSLEEIRKRSDNPSVIMLYDVACSLVRHLQNKRYFDLLSFYKFAIPVFHSY